MKKYSSATIWIIGLLLFFAVATFMLDGSSVSNRMVYSDFQQKWINNQVESINVNADKMTIEVTTQDEKKYTVYAPSSMIEFLNEQYPKDDIKIEYVAPSNSSIWVSLLPTIMIIILFVVFIFFFTQQSQGGGSSGRGVMNFGKSKAKMVIPDSKRVTFDDVAGADEEKAELEEIVDFLKQPERYVEMGARIPKGVLLVGPPGTGKTLLAKAIAGEAGVPFFSISGSDFVEMFVGVGASRVRDLFEQAKKNSPSLIFIDEIDAVGRQRGAGLGGGHDEREQTLNQLLVEMDGFGANEGIIMIAATNRPDILDPALLRPGRFDRQIMVGRPDRKGREAVLEVHTKKKPLDTNVSLEVLAKRTPGFSGADLENLANEAALLAVRKNKKKIGMDEFEEAITRVIAGPEKKSRTISEHDRKLTAYHEAGHAVVMKCLKNSDPVHEISIIPRGMAGGYTMHLPTEDRAYTSKEKLLDEMVGLLGGRVAEKLILGDISTGAKNDIDRASSIARAMVMEYGMSDKIGTISYGSDNNEVFLGRDLGRGRNFSEEVGAMIDKEIKSLISNAYNTAEELLKENVNKLHAVASTLLEKEKIDGKEFEEIFEAN
ncbi:MAG: ATP-dependent zinc metalloprotease FtsH [Clostridium sp.]|jgi:cell division protease FtsH|uniref:ATP-dependent zinc metalloprotease FtsH n=1 Tax=Clostridium sp. TaxID=1506 RepID=UPI002672EAEF|nr:ATP-dependent zinc metalloprotease FtsH [Clostridium sp.]MCI6188655.1 ATP-dependent zinc metalloprotease FtsH [Clostridium sp.]MCI7030427.1 ATP-dependent zinc metalloprotease FtsH [Clostridium sp.]MDD7683336.1 ATP-dependent zinc metalloprotease FtsH [Clostridium sp.]MDY2579059.1 ATP-dependent zinc metalloprotease FtsH [Clostridium sp.]MDY4077382.1 ATP-dependent zinc metalloprotease FtsH [Clostridium sp.]